MDVIEQINRKFSRYPEVSLDVQAKTISATLPQKDSFKISLYTGEDEYIVSFDGWHEHFESAVDALNCFAFGFCEECRLVVYARGGFRYKWVMEYYEDGRWREDSRTGLLIFPFFLPKRIQILQNHLTPREPME